MSDANKYSIFYTKMKEFFFKTKLRSAMRVKKVVLWLDSGICGYKQWLWTILHRAAVSPPTLGNETATIILAFYRFIVPKYNQYRLH
ncbi:MAG: hypothetical protein AAF738_10420, partial [Bacteroidota bacterium]